MPLNDDPGPPHRMEDYIGYNELSKGPSAPTPRVEPAPPANSRMHRKENSVVEVTEHFDLDGFNIPREPRRAVRDSSDPYEEITPHTTMDDL